MDTRLKIPLVIGVVLLFILLEGAEPVLGKKKPTLTARVKALEKTVKQLTKKLECETCSSIEQLNAAITEIEEEIKNLKNPPTSQPTPPPTKGPCTAVGVASQSLIGDGQMTATSVYLEYYPYKGRLFGKEGWCQGHQGITGEYLQVDMGAVRSVCKVATQGKKNGSWVTSYKLSFSTNGVTWNTYQEQGVDKVFKANTDLNTVVEHALTNEVQARYVRFYPHSYYKFPCMRVEVYVH